MTLQAIKKRLLDLAIHGSLVPQIESEGTADDILQAIAKEQKTKTSFSVIPESEQPFSIPSNWKWVRLGNISMSIFYGVSESAKQSGKYKLLRITDIQDNSVNWDTVPFTDFDDNKVSKYILEKGDILFARTGGSVGKSYLVAECPDNSIYASYLIRVRLFKDVDSKFIKFFFESPLYWSQVMDRANGTGQPNCNGEKLSNLFIPLPPLSEQTRIVTKLETMLTEIDGIEQSQKEIDGLKTAIWRRCLSEAISGRLTTQQPSDGSADDLLEQIKVAHREAFATTQKKYKPLTFSPIPDSEIPFEIPENWRWVRLGEICSFLSRGKSPKYSEIKKFPVFAQKCNLYNGWISLEQARFLDPATISKWPDIYKLRNDDILINSTGTGTVCRTRLFNESCLGEYPFVVPDSALKNLEEALKIINGLPETPANSDMKANILVGLGEINRIIGNIDTAQTNYLKALEIRENMPKTKKNLENLATLYEALGFLERSRRNLYPAQKYLNAAKEIFNQLNNKIEAYYLEYVLNSINL